MRHFEENGGEELSGADSRSFGRILSFETGLDPDRGFKCFGTTTT
jgi:hypothetical protein